MRLRVQRKRGEDAGERRFARRRGGVPVALSDPGSTRALEMALGALGGMMVLMWGLRLWGFLTLIPSFTFPTVGLTVLGLLLIAASLYADLPTRWAAVARWAGLVAVMAALMMWGYAQMLTTPSYGTDELAFDQYAAQLWVHGIDPYLRSMAPSLNLFQESPDNFTWQLNGKPVTTLSYPSLAFMIYALFIKLGAVSQIGNWVNLGAWAAGIGLMFLLLPRRLRPLALIWPSLSVYIGDVSGGVTDALYFPLLLLAAFQWDRFPTQRGWRKWVGPVALGLACAIKQTPWFLVPFVMVGIVLEAKGNRNAWRAALHTGIAYTGAFAAAFLVPNLPFIVGAPVAWLRGVLTPLLLPTVPGGQGIISITLFAGIGGGNLKLFTYAAVLLFLALLLWYIASYPRMKAWTFLLPSLFLVLPTRSLANYLTMLAPVAIVAAVTIARREPVVLKASANGLWRWPARVLASGAVAVSAWAVIVPAPLALAVSDVHTSGQFARIDRVTAVVTNRGHRPVRPAFTVENAGAVSAFWLRLSGPAVLAPGQGATYSLAAPNAFAMPPLTSAFRVIAFTSTPATVSLAAAFAPTTWHVGLAPTAIDHLVPIGVPIVVHAQLLNQLDQPVHVAGVPMYLGQVIYGQSGVQQGTAIVNGSLPGTPTVEAVTNKAGMAMYTIVGTKVTRDPVYLEANVVNNSYFYPYGYSSALSLRFK